MTNAPADLGELIITRIYEAPRELVFRCMTTAEDLTHFWGPTTTRTAMNIRCSACSSKSIRPKSWCGPSVTFKAA
jgi:uncharacterized protein YndB with AHSA1/START domain